MCRRNMNAFPPRRQRGFALVVAIFLLVVLASLGVYIVKISGVQHATVNIALMGARAFEAARTGIDWGAFQALDSGACTTTTLNLAEGGLAGFDVDVTCTTTAHTEEGNAYDLYMIDVEERSVNFGSNYYVSRRLRAAVNNASQ